MQKSCKRFCDALFTKNSDCTMADTVRIVLLGKSGAGKSSVGNTILEDDSAFVADDSANSGTHVCTSVERKVHGRNLTLIDTPGFFDTDPNNSDSTFKQEIMKCLKASAPGPHAFILVLKVEKYTPQEHNVVNLILQYFSDEALRYTTIVFTHGDQLPLGTRIEDWAKQNDTLRKLLARCGNRCHVVDNRNWRDQQGEIYRNNHNQVQDLLNTIEEAVRANGGSYFTNPLLKNPSLWQRFRDAPTGVQVAGYLGVPVVGVLLYKSIPWAEVNRWVFMTARGGVGWARNNLPPNEDLINAVEYLANLSKLYQIQDTVRIVLLGKSGAGKSSLGNTILEDDSAFKVDDSANSGTHVCTSVTRTVHGRNLTLIDTPGFFDTDPNNSDSTFKQEIMKCLKASAPGPHAFLLVLKVEKYTPQEHNVVNLILQYFSDEALRYTTIVFTHGDQLPLGTRIEDWARQNITLRELLARCGNRCHVVDNKYWSNQQGETYRNNRNQVQYLLNTIEEAVDANGGSYFTNPLLQDPSLWKKFRDSPTGVQLALILGVPVVGVLLYKSIPWAEVSHWVFMTAREGDAWARNNLPPNEDLIKAVIYLASLVKLFNQIQGTREGPGSVCTVL